LVGGKRKADDTPDSPDARDAISKVANQRSPLPLLLATFEIGFALSSLLQTAYGTFLRKTDCAREVPNDRTSAAAGRFDCNEMQRDAARRPFWLTQQFLATAPARSR
jgi:hypothetical protein